MYLGLVPVDWDEEEGGFGAFRHQPRPLPQAAALPLGCQVLQDYCPQSPEAKAPCFLPSGVPQTALEPCLPLG